MEFRTFLAIGAVVAAVAFGPASAESDAHAPIPLELGKAKRGIGPVSPYYEFRVHTVTLQPGPIRIQVTRTQGDGKIVPDIVMFQRTDGKAPPLRHVAASRQSSSDIGNVVWRDYDVPSAGEYKFHVSPAVDNARYDVIVSKR